MSDRTTLMDDIAFATLIISEVIGAIGVITTSILIHQENRSSLIAALVGFLIPVVLFILMFIGFFNHINLHLCFLMFIILMLASISSYIASIVLDKQPSHKALSTTIRVLVYAGLVFDVLCLFSGIISFCLQQ